MSEYYVKCPDCAGIGEQYHPTTGGFGEPLYAPTPCPARCDRGFVPVPPADRGALREAVFAAIDGAIWAGRSSEIPVATDAVMAALDRFAPAPVGPAADGGTLGALLARERGFAVALSEGISLRGWDALVFHREDGRQFGGVGDTPEVALAAALAEAEGATDAH